MLAILTLAIVGIGAVFIGLILWIVINKMRREAAEAHARARRRVLEPRVLVFAHGDTESLAHDIGVDVMRRDRRVLEAILLDHVRLVRGIERERLSHCLDELGFVGRNLAALDHSKAWRRAEAAELLGLAGARPATDRLARALDDPAPEVRMRAAKALGRLGGAASTRRLIQALGRPSRWSTLRIADVLTRMGGDVVEELIAAFPRMPVPGRVAALDVVARIRPLGATTWLVDQLVDSQRDVRARACHALGCVGDPGAAPALIDALGDEEWPVRAMAAKALGRMRIVSAAPVLSVALRDPLWWVRANAADALTRLGPAGEAALESMLGDGDRYARHQVALKLEELGVVDGRVAALVAEAGPARDAAERLVHALVASGRMGRLRALAAEHPDDAVRRALSGLLPAEGAAA